MHESPPARAAGPARSILLWAVALTAITFSAACDDSDSMRAPPNAGGGGGTSGASTAGGAGRNAAGSAGTVAGEAGAGGDSGAGGESDAPGPAGEAGNGGDAGAAGEAGAGPGLISNCSPGGAPLVVGNYVDAAGNQFLLRTAARSATFALVPAGPANPARLPRLFVIERVCSVGKALVASDESASYRLDFTQTGNQLAVCLSAPVATLDAAAALPRADATHAADTGCAGKPFTVFTAEAL